MKTVPAVLRPWVSRIDVDALSVDSPLTHLPEPAVTLVWRGDFVVVGPRTEASYFEGKDLPVCVRFRVRPGRARAVLGVDAASLVDRTAPLSDFWGRPAESLADELAELGHAAAVERLEGVLVQRLAEDGPRDALVRHAADGLAVGDRVRDTAERLGISERRLRDVFTASVGVSPKHFARITRLRRALAAAGRVPLASLAQVAGYYDQSHMAAEFRAMMHVAPGEFAAGRLPGPVAC